MFKIKLNKEEMKYELVIMEVLVKSVGTLKEITEVALDRGIEDSELTFAYKNMAKNKHTVANFGLSGKFLFSK